MADPGRPVPGACPPAPARISALREWLALTSVAALALTMLDAVLLQLRRDYFTGGFLSVDHASTWPLRLAFVGLAWMANQAVAGVSAAVAMVLARGLARAPRRFLVGMAAVLPCAIGSAVAFEVLRQLGDAFDFSLMFDLTGRSPREILAVAGGHLLRPLAALAACLGLVVGIAVVLQRRARHRVDGRLELRVGRLLGVSAGVLAVGLVVTTLARVSSTVVDNGLMRTASGEALEAVTEFATDVDRDGYGVLGRPPDPAPFDSHVFPYALDLPGNGIDEDGIGGDLPAGGILEVPDTAAPVFARRPDVVLVLLESFRADLVGATVNGRPVTPVLDSLGQRGLSHPSAYSHNGYTVQSRLHLFTGRLARFDGLTLIDDFHANGYQVAYFSGQDDSFGVGGLAKIYDRADVFYDARQDRDRRYTLSTTPGSLGVTSARVLERVGAFLDARSDDRPLFLYVNFYDTHFPYTTPDVAPLVSASTVERRDITPQNRARVSEMYANTAANVDRAIGTLVERVTQARGTRPAIVVLADHGESLFDEGFLGHGYAINEAQTRIPLIVDGLPMVLPTPAMQADLRGALVSALVGGHADVRPRIEARSSPPAFQYLGPVWRARQIAFRGAEELLLEDLRDARRGAPGEASATRLDLIRFWERLRLAEAAWRGESGGRAAVERAGVEKVE